MKKIFLSLLVSSFLFSDPIIPTQVSKETNLDFPFLMESNTDLGLIYLAAMSSLSCENEDSLLKKAEQLIRSGSDPNTKIIVNTSTYFYPIHIASEMRKSDHLLFLLQHGTNVHALNARHESALLTCVLEAKQTILKQTNLDISSLIKIVKILIEGGANIHESYKNLSLLTHSLFIPELTSYLLKVGAKNSINSIGMTPLNYAYTIAWKFQKKNPVIFQKLIESAKIILQEDGSNVNILSEDLISPLHYAVMLNLSTHIPLLIEKGAYLNSLDLVEDTPLGACLHEIRNYPNNSLERNSYLEIAKTLLHFGASIDISYGKSKITLREIIVTSIPELTSAIN